LAKRRAGFEKKLPKYAAKPNLLEKIKYRDLLMIAGLLGADMPMKIGNAEALRVWVAKKQKKSKGSKKKAKKKPRKH